MEDFDFTTVPQIYGTANGGHSTRTEYAITIEMAKELSMVENNEKGRTARKYFIECETRLKERTLLSESKISILLDIAKTTTNPTLKNNALFDAYKMINPNSDISITLPSKSPTGIEIEGLKSADEGITSYLENNFIIDRTKKEVYTEYMNYCIMNGFKYVPSISFASRLKDIGYNSKQVRIPKTDRRVYIYMD